MPVYAALYHRGVGETGVLVLVGEGRRDDIR
jgi:hypothetical protein